MTSFISHVVTVITEATILLCIYVVRRDWLAELSVIEGETTITKGTGKQNEEKRTVTCFISAQTTPFNLKNKSYSLLFILLYSCYFIIYLITFISLVVIRLTVYIYIIYI